MLEIIKTPFGTYAMAPNFREQMRIDAKAIRMHLHPIPPAPPAYTTLPEICRANIDAGHNTVGDWAAYIDACLDRQMATGIRTPVLITGFECKDGRGADVLRAGGEIGLWRQEPYRYDSVEGLFYDWHIANFPRVGGPWTIPQEIYWMLAGSLSGVQGRYSCVETAKFDLLAAMVRYAHAELKKSITAQG